MRIEPHVDLSTGRIYGCRKGSWMWWHEKGHLVFNDLPTTSRLKMWQILIFGLWMFTVTLAIVNHYMLILTIPLLLTYLGIDLYEEIWCNQYANKNCKKRKHI